MGQVKSMRSGIEKNIRRKRKKRTKTNIEIKIRKGKESERKRRRKERKLNMQERNRERTILATLKTVMILVMMKIRSSVYLMSQFSMKIIQFISQCTIRLRHEDLVLKLERRRKQGNRKKL